MPRTPDITVAAVTQTADRFLIVEERINRRLVFNQPAGHVEQGESLLTAVVREVQEETAWRFVPEALLGVYLWRNPSSGRSTLRFAFVGAVADHDSSQALDRGIVRTHWLSQPELLQRHAQLRSPLVMRCIEDFGRGNFLAVSEVAGIGLDNAATVTPTAIL